MDKELGCVYLRRRTTDKENHSTVAGEKLSNGTETNVGEWFGVIAFSAICGVAHVFWGSYRIPLLSKYQPLP